AARPVPSGPSAVLFIGDGMGPAYVTATRVARGGSRGRLHLDDLPRTALVRTYSADSPVTDSAAAASAMACGRKTVNGVLCEDATALNGRRDGARLESIAVWAKRQGMRVALVTTARITHATPAAFYAVDDDRDHERAIARAAIASSFDLLLGGGRQFFLPGPPVPDDHGWQASDREDLEATARARGVRVVVSAVELREVTSISRTRVIGLFADSHLPYEAELTGVTGIGGRAASATTGAGVAAAPGLVEMTRRAIDLLKGTGQPFFLMVEGGRIDHAGHDNWVRTLIDETAAFDAAVGVAVAALDPKSTLVLVTADHETGGLAINGYPDGKDGLFSTYDPGEEGAPYPVLSFASGPGSGGPPDPAAPHGSEDPRPSTFRLKSAAHTGVDVALYGWGAGSERVHGTLENTAVYQILKEHLEKKGPAGTQRPRR
ncbi:MAG TPA: alkaline phosphatase, partial [Candidatus Polarisedimenticolia bacterium]|nr:alkaline phosphatase [Candidatus Polarisedimenticolia bacterium]